jgi:hypothetical protein
MTALLITGQQVKFLSSLMEERVGGADYVASASKGVAVDALDRKKASEMIGFLLKEPKVTKAKMAVSAAPKNFVSEVGIYKGSDDNLYKVQESKFNPGRFYTKRLVVSGKGKASFEYDKSGMQKISVDSKVSLAEAIAFGLQFNVCCRCGRDLTATESVEAGIGPVCIKYFN